MNRICTATVLAAAALLLTGCSSAPPKADGRPATICDAKTWPQPVPDVVGKPLTDTVDGPLLCFNITAATAPDHHDAFHDPAIDQWTITSITPKTGTPVTADQAMTLTVDNHNN